MADDRRKNEVDGATVHRVYRLAESLRQAVSPARRRDLGLTPCASWPRPSRASCPRWWSPARPPSTGGEKTRPPLAAANAALLGLLRQASEDAGVSAAKLLACCLARAAARKRRRLGPHRRNQPRPRRLPPRPTRASPSPQEAIEPAVRREDAIGPAEPAAESAGDPELP